jgi:hypothetical protein
MRVALAIVCVYLATGGCGTSECGGCGAGSCSDLFVGTCGDLTCPSSFTVPSECSDALRRDCSSTADAAFLHQFGVCISSKQPYCVDSLRLVIDPCQADAGVSSTCRTTLNAQIAAAQGS